jgi:hypothetical protein
MAEKRKQTPVTGGTTGQSAENALDSVNAELKSERDEPRSLRRQMEATIESKAKKRRRNEAPVSSSFKPHG